MLKISYIIYWKVLSVLVLIGIYYHLLRLHYSVSYRQSQVVVPARNISTTIEICYELALEKATCKETVENRKEPKVRLGRYFEKPVHCYTQGLSGQSPKDIIEQFKNSDIAELTNVISESNQTIKSDGVEYELFANHLCLKHRFDVQPEEEVSTLKVWPREDNKQSFYILIQSSRAFENRPLHFSLKQVLLERYCWIANWKGDNHTYHCTDDDSEIDFEMTFFSQIHLEWPFESNCVHRDGIDQYTCWSNCIKEHTNYYKLTYDEKDEKTLNYDENAASRHFGSCTLRCRQPDCVTGTFAVPTLVQKNSTTSNFIVIKVTNLDMPTEARPKMKMSKVLYAAVVYFSLFFGVNLYGLFRRAMNLYLNPAKPSKKRKLLPKRVLASIVTCIVGVVLAVIFEMKTFDLGNLKKTVVSKLDSIKERNVSVSICYDLCSILKEDVDSAIKENCTDELLMNNTVQELDEMTWSVKQFKANSSMRNSVRIVPIRQEDYPIWVFFREFKKCFLLFYEGKNLYPPISLQRKSFLHLNSSNSHAEHDLAYFYIEDGFTFPQLDAPKNRTSFLHNIYITDYGHRDCTDYASVYGFCSSRDDCIQQCVLKFYDKPSVVPYFVNLKLENKTTDYLDLKFDSNYTFFKTQREICENEVYPERACYSIKTTLRTKYLLPDPHNISVTLTPRLIYTHWALDECTPVVINRIISFFIILTGISVKDAVKGFIANYFYSFASLYNSLYNLYNYTFINRAAYLVVFLFFSMHFAYLFCSIVFYPMKDSSYRTVLEKLVLPKIRICYEISTNLSEDRYSKQVLDRESLNVTEILVSLAIMDGGYQKHKMKKGNVLNSSIVKQYDFYVDNFKCFNFDFKISYPLLSTSILESDRIVTFELNITKVPKRRVFLFLNSKNSLDFEWYMPFTPGYYSIQYITEDQVFQDDFCIFKNLFAYIKTLFGLETWRGTHHLYYRYLRDSFLKEQFVTTTVCYPYDVLVCCNLMTLFYSIRLFLWAAKAHRMQRFETNSSTVTSTFARWLETGTTTTSARTRRSTRS